MVVSHTAKESRIYMCTIIKSTTTMRIYTQNNGACIHPYRTTMLHTLLIFLSYWSLQDHYRSINFGLDIKQFGASSKDSVTTPVV